MKILSHRGYWIKETEKNTKTAFLRSFKNGFGTETDVRDLNGKLVISHDPATGDEMTFKDFLLFCPHSVPLAFNIKADGLAGKINEELLLFPNIDWFVFDMSIPDMRSYLEKKNPVFARMSEVERDAPWIELCDGVWLDAFDDVWYDDCTIENILNSGQKICIVSPELHKRDYWNVWDMIKRRPEFMGSDRLYLCTDYPEKAKKYFGL